MESSRFSERPYLQLGRWQVIEDTQCFLWLLCVHTWVTVHTHVYSWVFHTHNVEHVPLTKKKAPLWVIKWQTSQPI